MAAKVLSAGVIVLHWRQNHYEYLLLRAYNYWDFPKGVVEPGETPLTGAIREVEEETAITQLRFRWGHVYRETSPYNHGRKVARYYIAETPSTRVQLPINPLLGRPEHTDYRWVTRAKAWQMLTPRVQAVLVWADSIIGKKSPR